MLNIQFINRVYELDMICQPGAPRFIVVDGAAGYGKTYLLDKIKESYEKNDHQPWKAALVDLKSDPQMTSTDSNVAWPCIANAIVEQFGSVQRTTRLVSNGSAAGTISGLLVPFLARQKADILLLFDSVDVLPRETSVWLKHLFSDLDQGLQQVPCELRVVLAGRFTVDWRRGASFPIFTLSLSPFGRVAVRDMVEQIVIANEFTARQEYLADLSWWVLHISGGHPQGICQVLDVISSAGFIFPDLEFAFLKMEFKHNGKTGTLFELCIKPIIEEILASIEDPALCEVMARISPIRRFDAELVDLLEERGVMSAPKFSTSWDLIRALLRTRLISPPTKDPMYSDQIVRRMLAMQMQIVNPELFREINLRAQEIFHNWASDPREIRNDIRRVAILECLYHTLQLEARNCPPSEIQEKLSQKLVEYLAGIREQGSVHRLWYALDQDHELNDLIERRAGRAAVSNLLDIIDSFLT
jgi:hypothetical protein